MPGLDLDCRSVHQQLRERIKVLEYEKEEYKKQNEKMTGQLYQIGIKLDLFNSVKQENFRQGEEIKKLKAELEATKNKLAACQIKLIKSNPKVTSIKSDTKFLQEIQLDF